jgi:hypothetical protein
MTNDIGAALDQALRLLSRSVAPAAEFTAAIQETQAAIGALDEAATAASQRRASVLTIPPTEQSRGLAAIVTALETLDADGRRRALQREVALAFLAQLEVRSREAKKAQAMRDEARKPFDAETKRARDYAKRVVDALGRFDQVVHLFRTDAILTKLAVATYSCVPSPQGTHVAYERNITVEPAIATQERLRATRLPGRWRGSDSDVQYLIPSNWSCNMEEDGADDRIVGPLRELCRQADDRRITLSNGQVDQVLAQAQAVVMREYDNAAIAIREVLALDAQLAAADRAARYPDGALIFDPSMFPENWLVGSMSRRVVLPSIGGMAMAAE